MMTTDYLQQVVLDLQVNNHAGVMAHIVGLFARRGFNLEGILVLPEPQRTISRIWLLVNHDKQLSQMIAQLQKLQDVQAVQICEEDEHQFSRLQTILN